MTGIILLTYFAIGAVGTLALWRLGVIQILDLHSALFVCLAAMLWPFTAGLYLWLERV